MDVMLSLWGVSPFKNLRPLCLIVVWTIRLLFLLTILTIVLSFILLPGRDALKHFSLTSIFVISAAVHTLLTANFKKFLAFRKKIEKLIGHDHRLFTLYSRISLATLLLICFCLSTLHLKFSSCTSEIFDIFSNSSLGQSAGYTLFVNVWDVTFVSFIGESGIVISVIVYIYGLLLVDRLEKLYQELCIMTRTDDLEKFYSQCLLMKTQVDMYWKKFERQFNIHPFLWYFWIFVSFQGLIQGIHGEGVVKQLPLIVIFITSTVFAFTAAGVITYSNRKRSAGWSKVILSIRLQDGYRKETTELRNELIRRLSAPRTKLTGFKLFDMGTTFCLIFVDGLVTLTIVFLQIQGVNVTFG